MRIVIRSHLARAQDRGIDVPTVSELAEAMKLSYPTIQRLLSNNSDKVSLEALSRLIDYLNDERHIETKASDILEHTPYEYDSKK